ncbi:MAG TPA: hypothetical protein VJL10_06350 [Anaerolineales bacterium]|nr:hypothetical protein [Anaerolineales bacterium]
MTVAALGLSIFISIASLAMGYAQAGFEGISIWIVLFGSLWIFSQWRGWRWVSSLGLFSVMLAAMIGLWFDFIVGWMLSGAIFALFAWDMTDFRQKLKSMTSREDIKGMERRHIARLYMLALAGLILTSIMMSMRAQFSYAWNVLLGFVILLGLLQLFVWFRR